MTDSLSTEASEGYDHFEQVISSRVANQLGPLFTTSVDEGSLWGHFIMNIPEERRQHYNCNACKKFIQNYGGLVKIGEDGGLEPLIFNGGIPTFFQKSAESIRSLLLHAKVTGVFLSSAKVWGIPKTNDPKHNCVWTHLHGIPPKVFKHAILSDEQAIALRLEEYKMLNRAVAEYPKAAITEAIKVLKAEAVSQSEKALAVAEWFDRVSSANANQRWLAVATAPAGFCHVKNTILGTLLDDIVAGLPFEDIKKRWAEKVNPLTYQRAQVAPAAGTIKQAEEIVAKLGVARSLERRFAVLEDVKTFIWQPAPKAAEPETQSVFWHLKPKSTDSVKPVALPPKDISWEKFLKTILPDAKSIRLTCPGHGSYYGLVTALHPDAPNIFQWDNPVSWYFYHGGSSAQAWNLSPFASVKVSGIFASPPEWDPNPAAAKFGEKIFFALEGAKDVYRTVGIALFSETLRNEFHSIRSVVEAHSKSKSMAPGDGNAHGVAFQKGSSDRLTLEVDGNTYFISRWD